MTIVDGRDDLPEEVSGLPLAEAPPLADVVVQLPFAGVLHDDHNLIFVLKHWGGTAIHKHPVYPTISLMTGTAEMSLSEGRGKQLQGRTQVGPFNITRSRASFPARWTVTSSLLLLDTPLSN